MMTHIGPPLGKSPPVPDYWLESMRLQLLRKSKKNRMTGARHVQLMDFMVSLVTRAMGLEAMSEVERDAYLTWVRSTSNSQLACLFRNMMKQDVLLTGAALYLEKRRAKDQEAKNRQSKMELERTALSKDKKFDP